MMHSVAWIHLYSLSGLTRMFASAKLLISLTTHQMAQRDRVHTLFISPPHCKYHEAGSSELRLAYLGERGHCATLQTKPSRGTTTLVICSRCFVLIPLTNQFSREPIENIHQSQGAW